MIKFTVILLICIIHVPVYADQNDISKETLLVRSLSLASEIGKTYQLAKNCGQEMANISAVNTASLFRNNFEEHEVKTIMKQYQLHVSQKKGELCNRDKVQFHLLMNKIAVYIRTTALLVK